MTEVVLDGGNPVAGRFSGGNVVLAFDGTSETRAALGTAIEQTVAFGGRLLIVFGVEPPGARTREGLKEHRRALEELGSKLASGAADEARAAGVETEVLLVPRKLIPAVCEVARESDSRMVVVGTRGEGPLKGALTGSVAHGLLSLCDTPVLCVKGAE